jgi:T5SS/PEP-CTERM-associated repeat protein
VTVAPVSRVRRTESSNHEPNFFCVVVAVLTVFAGSLHAVPNNWVSPTNGFWRITNNWSLAQAPNGTSGLDPTMITNAGTKTVTIDSATLAANLAVRTLNVSAPVGSTNTLALVNVSAAALTPSKPFLVGSRGALLITNSAVNATDTFDISNAVVVLDSGSLTCAANCDLQSGSLIVNTGSLTVGALTTGIRMGRFSGANCTFNLNGGTVTTPRCVLGNVAGSTATLNIAGGNLLCTSGADPFNVGQLQVTTCNVNVTSGSLIATNGFSGLADRATATFNQTGGTVMFGDLTIGGLGFGTYNLSGGSFTVTPFTNINLFIIGNLENADFNQTGGVASIRCETHIADTAGVVGNLNITGGQYVATNDLTAIGRYGLGTMNVSNATVLLTNTSVGRHPGGQGILNVRNGANVQVIADFSIGRLTGSSGQMFVEAGGAFSVANDDLWIGRGGAGELTISGGLVTAQRLQVGANDGDTNNLPTGTFTQSGGTAQFDKGWFIGTAGLSAGTATMSGGVVASTNSAGTNQINIANGSLTMNGGTVIADKLVATNTTGQFTFNNGLLRAKSITIANGTAFVVGDGVNPATLELQGGVYTFADGLVISPNATVTGCGTIIGALTNNGTYLNPCAGPPPATISSVSRVGSAASVAFVSTSGVNYTLEFKNALTDPTWTPILPAQPGTGGTMTLSDSTATNRTRFYRVGAQ